MAHLPELIQDLAFILVTAAIVTLIFKKFKQPVVLGYLIAGFFLGPHFPFFINVKDTANVTIWAEIGVIFLLFGLGLEFSFKKLTRVGKSAGITAFIESSFMLGLGFITGQFIGWNTIDSIYLGGVMCISSTTIIVRAFGELGLKGKKFVSLVFGVLIVEDLIAILLLVLLTTIAVTNTLSGTALFNATLKLGFFLTLWFLIGIYVIPNLLKRVKSLLTPETTVVISIGLCLLMVLIATSVGFSAPLGAFIMGSILAETKEGHNIEHLLSPIKDLFGAIFFVSVGMLINPNALVEYWWIILIITLVTIIGKIFSVGVGALLSGQSLKTAMYTGMSLAQIGEFSFIIATLGLTLKVTSDFIYPIAVAVSAITTFTTPYLIRSSEGIFNTVDKMVPERVRSLLLSYEKTFNTKSEEGVLSLIWRAYGIKLILNFIIVVGIVLFTDHFILKFVIPTNYKFQGLGSIMAIAIATPFLWAIMFGGPSNEISKKSSSAFILRNLLIGVTLIKLTIGIFIVLGIIIHYEPIKSAYLITLIIITASALLLKNFVAPYYSKIEKRFINNLNAKELEELESQKNKPILTPWDATLAEFTVSPDSSIVGKTLQESLLKEKFGVTVALIERGHHKLIAPGRESLLMSFDKLFIIGNDSELLGARALIEEANQDEFEDNEDYALENLTLSENSPYIEKTIKNCGLREAIRGLIVGIERDGNRFLNPDSSMILKRGDVLWVVADTKKVHKI